MLKKILDYQSKTEKAETQKQVANMGLSKESILLVHVVCTCSLSLERQPIRRNGNYLNTFKINKHK
mgnify:CR=1 FL=1